MGSIPAWTEPGGASQNFRTVSASCFSVFSVTSPVPVSYIAIVCCRVCKSTPIIRIEASSGSSPVRVNTETVDLGRVGPLLYDISLAVAQPLLAVRGIATLYNKPHRQECLCYRNLRGAPRQVLISWLKGL